MEAILFLLGVGAFFYWLFFKSPQKNGARTKCPNCGSKHTKSLGPDYSTAQKGGRVNHIVRCLDCNHNYIATGAHDSSWL